MKNRLLLRQLKAQSLGPETPPASLEAWQAFLGRIEKAYGDADQERYLLERSLLISSREMQERWRLIELEREKAAHSGKMASLGEMAGGVAHEINNPLAVIVMMAAQARELLEDKSVEVSQVVPLLEKVETTAARIAKIVQGLRTFSRDCTKDPYERADVQAVLDDTLALCSERFLQNKIRLTFEKAGSDFLAECRPTQISQVALNLLNNARDAVIPLGEKWVRLEIAGGADFVEVAVVDSGPGIPAEIAEKMFQPFYTTKEPGKGTGLGLSLSLGIIADHGGTLQLDKDCANTRLSFRIPRSQAARKPRAA